jgi:glycosyltransferase involved in cell wall biosynthesis
MTNGKLIHLDIKKWDFLRQGLFFDEKHHWTTEWVEDHELVELYKSCKFVSGLRSGSGFEVPVLEGASMGATPICFDNIYYRQWFNDFAVFIPEEFDVDMATNLVNIYNNYDMFKMSVEQIKHVRDKFKWETIAKNFWAEVLRSL